MSIGETVLRAISRDPGAGDYPNVLEHDQEGLELSAMIEAFPGFIDMIRGRRVVDFGCGTGRQAVALVREAECFVCGVDTNARTLAAARAYAEAQPISEESIQLVERPDADLKGSFDYVISQNSMEHFPDPAAVLREMASLLKPTGKILITFGAPWYSPWGSHMHFFCRLPWLNVWFSERTIMSVRSLYRDDGATRYEEVESGLNKMSLRKFERLVRESGLLVEHREYWCVKRLDFLAYTPVREFFVNQINCVLALAGRTAAGPASA